MIRRSLHQQQGGRRRGQVTSVTDAVAIMVDDAHNDTLPVAVATPIVLTTADNAAHNTVSTATSTATTSTTTTNDDDGFSIPTTTAVVPLSSPTTSTRTSTTTTLEPSPQLPTRYHHGYTLTIHRKHKEIGHENPWNVYHIRDPGEDSIHSPNNDSSRSSPAPPTQLVTRLVDGDSFSFYGMQPGQYVLLELRGVRYRLTVMGGTANDNAISTPHVVDHHHDDDMPRHHLHIRLKHKLQVKGGLGSFSEKVWIQPSKTNNPHLQAGWLEWEPHDHHHHHPSSTVAAAITEVVTVVAQ